jgi:hypothetical protein
VSAQNALTDPSRAASELHLKRVMPTVAGRFPSHLRLKQAADPMLNNAAMTDLQITLLPFSGRRAYNSATMKIINCHCICRNAST